MPNRSILVHVHIPKNGGTTFRAILKRVYGEGFLSAYVDQPGYFFSAAEWIEQVSANGQASCITTHYIRTPLPEIEGVTYKPITFLREPIQRLTSLYFYERKITLRNGVEHCSQLPFDEYFAERVTQDEALENWQTRHIAGEVDLYRAYALLEDYSFVGIVERYDESLLLLGEKMGWRSDINIYRRQRPGIYDKDALQISPRVLSKLREMNEADSALHEQFTHRLQATIEAGGRGFQRKLAVAKQVNSLLNVLIPTGSLHRFRQMMVR